MGSGISKLYPSLQKQIVNEKSEFDSPDKPKELINGTDYNTAGSSSVKEINSVKTTNGLHSIPQCDEPNSVLKNYQNGKVSSERYFDSSGNAYLDIDYTDHGNSKMHPNVPHEHSIYFDNNRKMHRNEPPQGGIKK